MELLTFGLATAGYAGLTAAAVLATRGRAVRWLLGVVAVIVLAHVVLVWEYRFAWNLNRATRNGYAGFTIFHLALTGIVAAPFIRSKRATRVAVGCFLLVTVGATAAVFRDQAAATFRLPVIACALIGITMLVWARIDRPPAHRE